MIESINEKLLKTKIKKMFLKLKELMLFCLQGNQVNIDYQMNSRNSFPPMKFSSSKFVHLKFYKSELSEIKVWFTGQDILDYLKL